MAEATPLLDVLVVGSGPTGLTLACDLARRGVAVRLVERAERPSTASRAKTIQPRAIEVLDDLGVAARIVEEGAVNVPSRMYDRDRVVSEAVVVAGGAPTPDAPYQPVWISQPKVEQALRDRLADLGGTVEWGAEITGLAQDAEGVTATLATRDGAATVRARYVVGADGGRSTVRRLAGIALHGTSYADQRWHLGDVRLDGLSRHCQHVWMTKEDGILSLFPLPGTDLWQFQASIPADVRDPEEPSLELFRRILADRTQPADVKITDADWLSLYKINVCLADRYRTGRVFLAGDAAHIHSPAGGQGMNTGIQDAYNLGWKLAAVLAGADPVLLDSYEQERRPVAQGVLDDSTTRMHRVMRAAADSEAGERQRGLTDEFTTGLLVGYPEGPLSAGPGAGLRAPDAPCHDAATGHDVRLFDLQRGPHWTLLSFGPAPLPAAGVPDTLRMFRVVSDLADTSPDTVLDTHGHARRAHAARNGELILIRPDGYIATRRPARDLPTVIALAR